MSDGPGGAGGRALTLPGHEALLDAAPAPGDAGREAGIDVLFAGGGARWAGMSIAVYQRPAGGGWQIRLRDLSSGHDALVDVRKKATSATEVRRDAVLVQRLRVALAGLGRGGASAEAEAETPLEPWVMSMLRVREDGAWPELELGPRGARDGDGAVTAPIPALFHSEIPALATGRWRPAPGPGAAPAAPATPVRRAEGRSSPGAFVSGGVEADGLVPPVPGVRGPAVVAGRAALVVGPGAGRGGAPVADETGVAAASVSGGSVVAAGRPERRSLPGASVSRDPGRVRAAQGGPTAGTGRGAETGVEGGTDMLPPAMRPDLPRVSGPGVGGPDRDGTEAAPGAGQDPARRGLPAPGRRGEAEVGEGGGGDDARNDGDGEERGSEGGDGGGIESGVRRLLTGAAAAALVEAAAGRAQGLLQGGWPSERQAAWAGAGLLEQVDAAGRAEGVAVEAALSIVRGAAGRFVLAGLTAGEPEGVGAAVVAVMRLRPQRALDPEMATLWGPALVEADALRRWMAAGAESLRRSYAVERCFTADGPSTLVTCLEARGARLGLRYVALPGQRRRCPVPINLRGRDAWGRARSWLPDAAIVLDSDGLNEEAGDGLG